jgi:hypothetical protein
MVGRLTLDQVVKVRVLAPQPQKQHEKHLRKLEVAGVAQKLGDGGVTRPHASACEAAGVRDGQLTRRHCDHSYGHLMPGNEHEHGTRLLLTDRATSYEAFHDKRKSDGRCQHDGVDDSIRRRIEPERQLDRARPVDPDEER